MEYIDTVVRGAIGKKLGLPKLGVPTSFFHSSAFDGGLCLTSVSMSTDLHRISLLINALSYPSLK
ncbi:hypothetical protein ADUPG1_004178, partial [Aduncisulcus paluster]